MLGNRLLVFLDCPRKLVDVLRASPGPQDIDEAFHRLDCFLRLSRRAVDAGKVLVRFLLLGGSLDQLPEGLRRLSGEPLIVIQVCEKDLRPRIARVG